MITNAFAIYDRKALRYNAPFFSLTVGEAVRSFTDAVNDPQTTLSRYPGDFVLYRVGSFDDSSGELLVCNPPEHVADADALVRVAVQRFDVDKQATFADVEKSFANGKVKPGT